MLDPRQKEQVGGVVETLRHQGSLLLILAAMLILVPFLPAPQYSVRWHGAQSLGVEVGVVTLLVTLLSNQGSGRSVQGLLRQIGFPPLTCLSLLFGWGVISYALAADRAFATQGLFSLAGEVFLTFLVCDQVRRQRQMTFLLDALLGAGLLVALSSVAMYGTGRASIVVGVLHDHQLLGAFLLLLVPISLSVSLSPGGAYRRLYAQATFVACQIALLVSQTRSSWIGEGVTLAMFGGLLWWTGPRRIRGSSSPAGRLVQTQKTVSVAVVVLVATAFVGLSPEREAVVARASTLTSTVLEGRDDAFQWRVSAWAGAKKMVRQKPFLGWGIGNYPRFQSAFTGIGRAAPQVQTQGPLITNEAHNSYLQIWAEIGLVGLLFWLAALIAFLAAGISALRRLPAGGLEQRVLIGCVSALAGQMTDALANPAWQFGSVSLYFWVILGLIAALSFSPTKPVAQPPDSAVTVAIVAWRIARTVAALAIGVWLLRLLWQTAVALPAPYL